jgi:hypothetical protein
LCYQRENIGIDDRHGMTPVAKVYGFRLSRRNAGPLLGRNNHQDQQATVIQVIGSCLENI